MSTKINIINKSYSKLRISGITVNPSTESQALALGELESMMSELFHAFNLDVNYNFENSPNINSQTEVPLQFENMMVTNLATRLISDFNKTVPQTLMAQASQSVSQAIGILAAQNVRQVASPRRMPRGSGSTLRNEYWSRFSIPVSLPPNDAETNKIVVGETQDYQESFAAYLGTETIASFTIVADTRLTIDSSANATPIINFRVTANTSTATGTFQKIQIEITTSSGRVDVRTLDFEVIDKPVVG